MVKKGIKDDEKFKSFKHTRMAVCLENFNFYFMKTVSFGFLINKIPNKR